METRSSHHVIHDYCTTAHPNHLFDGTAGHEAAIATFIDRVEQYTRQECKRRGERYSLTAFKRVLDTATANLVADDLPF